MSAPNDNEKKKHHKNNPRRDPILNKNKLHHPQKKLDLHENK